MPPYPFSWVHAFRRKKALANKKGGNLKRVLLMGVGSIILSFPGIALPTLKKKLYGIRLYAKNTRKKNGRDKERINLD